MSTRFNGSEGLIVVDVRITGPGGVVAAKMALDTGAARTMVNADILRFAGYDAGASAERTRVTTASGVEFMPCITVTRLSALRHQRRKIVVVSHTLPPSASVHGLLGLDFFRGRILTIDFVRDWIRME